jgi:DMSO/TMAO reductase YedYZ heme-binding membrane subunit
MVIRGSGIAAYALLSASVIWGLLVSSKVLGRLVKAKGLTFLHESLGISALVATAVHVGYVSVHEFLPFTWGEILVPGTSEWRPLPIAMGTMALYGLIIVVVSFYVRRFIGQKWWRIIHFGAFGVFVASLIHGVMAGTDSSSPWVIGLYLGTAVAVFALIALRLTPTAEGAPRGRVQPARSD